MSKTLKIKLKGFKIIDVKADSALGVVEAYVSIFGNVDLAQEVVDKGAFTESLAKKFPKMVWSHDWQQPIGVTLEAREDEKGLYIKAQLVKGVQKAEEALSLMLAGAIDEFSIGYSVQEDYIGNDGFRHLKKLRLYEYSPVLVGANQDTELLSVKSATGEYQTGVGVEKEIDEEENEEQKPPEETPEPALPTQNEEEKKKADLVAGDPCTMEDGSEGVYEDEDGTLVCKLKKSAELPVEEKQGRVLSEKNRELLGQVIEDADNLIKSLKNVVSPLRELHQATEPQKGIKVAPTSDFKKTVRIRQAAKQAKIASEYVLRVTK